MPINDATLQIQDFDTTIPVNDDMMAAAFTVDLKQGETKLRTWFNGDDGLSLGAYWVYVSLVD